MTRSRAHLLLGLVVIAASVVVLGRSTASGPPRLLTTGRDANLIVNFARPVQLRMLVVDAAGHALPDSGVHYTWTSGAPVAVSPGGVVTCAQPGDAVLRASLGSLATDVSLRCRPVHDVRAEAMFDLVVGGPARDVPFEAVDGSGRRVTLLSGQLRVGDSSVARLQGQRILAGAAGTTWVTARFGDHASFTAVHAYERVRSIEAIQPGQHLAMSVRLAPREMRQWVIPAGAFAITMLSDGGDQSLPGFAVVGAQCKPVLAHLFCSARERTTVVAYYPQGAEQTRTLTGTLAIWRQDDP